jgi:hypothetical protein
MDVNEREDVLRFQGAAPNGQPETPRNKGFWSSASQEKK